MNDFYEVEALSFCTWKYSKFGHFLMWKSFSRAIFWKPLLPTTNQRMANGRSIFPLEKTVLISKIGQREPLFFSVWKFFSRSYVKKWRVLSERAMNKNTPVKHCWNICTCTIIHNSREF